MVCAIYPRLGFNPLLPCFFHTVLLGEKYRVLADCDPRPMLVPAEVGFHLRLNCRRVGVDGARHPHSSLQETRSRHTRDRKWLALDCAVEPASVVGRVRIDDGCGAVLIRDRHRAEQRPSGKIGREIGRAHV